jgi:hypothetical protein
MPASHLGQRARAAGLARRPRGQLDRLVGVAPDPHPGRPSGRCLSGRVGLDLAGLGGALQAAVRPNGHGPRAPSRRRGRRAGALWQAAGGLIRRRPPADDPLRAPIQGCRSRPHRRPVLGSAGVTRRAAGERDRRRPPARRPGGLRPRRPAAQLGRWCGASPSSPSDRPFQLVRPQRGGPMINGAHVIL